MADWIPDTKPSWWDDLGPIVKALSGSLDTLKDFLNNPAAFVRGIIFGAVLSGIAAILKPIFTAIQLVALGSDPAEFAARGEVWGLLDVPVALAEDVGYTIGRLIRSLIDAVQGVVLAALPTLPGPLDGIIATGVIVVVAVFVARVAVPVLATVLEAVPVVGGPLSSLLQRL